MMIYPGGKNGAGVFQSIINQMPPHDRYIEPFLGSGAVFRLKSPARVNVGIDIDPKAIALFSELLGRPAGGVSVEFPRQKQRGIPSPEPASLEQFLALG